ncbi:MAG: hypothetical protein ABIQ18_20530 [Umezawaea sp.]
MPTRLPGAPRAKMPQKHAASKPARVNRAEPATVRSTAITVVDLTEEIANQLRKIGSTSLGSAKSAFGSAERVAEILMNRIPPSCPRKVGDVHA